VDLLLDDEYTWNLLFGWVVRSIRLKIFSGDIIIGYKEYYVNLLLGCWLIIGIEID